MAVLAYRGKKPLAEQITKDMVLRLFVNNKTPLERDSVSNYVEMNGYGYFSKELPDLKWNAKKRISEVEEFFVFNSGGVDVYGYYVTIDDVLIWAERFEDAPYKVRKNGDSLKIKLKMRIKG